MAVEAPEKKPIVPFTPPLTDEEKRARHITNLENGMARLQAEIREMQKLINGLEMRLIDHETEETKEIKAVSEAPYNTRAWVQPKRDDPNWPLIIEYRRLIAMSAIRAGLVAVKRPDEDSLSYEKRVMKYCENVIKTNPEFKNYVEASGLTDPWSWKDGLQALAEQLDGEPSQFVVIVKRSWS